MWVGTDLAKGAHMKWHDEGDGRWTAEVPGRIYTVTESGGFWSYSWEQVPPSGRMLPAGHVQESRELAQAEAEGHWRR